MKDRKHTIIHRDGVLILWVLVMMFWGKPDIYDGIMCQLLPNKCESILSQYEEDEWFDWPKKWIAE